MLAPRALMTPRGVYTTFWKPKDIVSGDLYEAMQYGNGTYLYVLGDLQGHGTSAALAMTAVQAFLKQFRRDEGRDTFGPAYVANMLQDFFRRHLTDLTYMTALICIHRPLEGYVDWISCGAPDLVVIDKNLDPGYEVNPEKRGGLPIGLMADTVYSEQDVVHTPLSDFAVCALYSDGISDVGLDEDNAVPMPENFFRNAMREIVIDARSSGSLIPAPQKIMTQCEESGYTHYADDVTLICFGKRIVIPGIFEMTARLRQEEIEETSLAMGAWCAQEGWDAGLADRTQLVLEETLMNVHDHGVDIQDRLGSVFSVRLKMVRDFAELTVWDSGAPVPSVGFAGGSSDTQMELKNKEYSGRGRGRLMTRALCNGISRSRYQNLNETIFYIPLEFKNGGEK